ncbi:transglutaminase domain-containing protein [Ructibacterium gallinarum]|uniref:S-layer homology domain-containing protein n=1 Tax=Ructibacterium gallinarum TaxID=2779355 RepID=A0A9D5LZZ8_9FIRM|nr:transglutaminase domain-containing protein [Ructibacterium gallinarum]MBE5039636.1 S-layer homology domain-containing protein [Ructibacterium gallinarum]
MQSKILLRYKKVLMFLCSVLISGLLQTLLPVSAFSPTYSYEEDAVNAAVYLYSLGLFQGVGLLPNGMPDFALTETPTRGQAITMLVRLLGGEQESLENAYAHPFLDSDWASPYIGYAYYYGLSNGVSNELFGTEEPISLNQFLTLVLRALDYEDVDWENPYATAEKAGLIYYDGEFMRGDIAFICANALDCFLKGSSMTLYQKLESQGSLSYSALPVPLENSEDSQANVDRCVIQVRDGDTMIREFYSATQNQESTVFLLTPTNQETNCVQILFDALEAGAFPEANGLTINYAEGSGTAEIIVSYQDSAEIIAYLEGRRETLSAENFESLAAAQRIVEMCVSDGMSSYDKVKAFHDYLIRFNSYEDTGERSHMAAGALIDGSAVCEGYSEAFQLLCYLGGIECRLISGTAGGQEHAWNKVNIDGTWYNVDVTWDDPVSIMPMLLYDYFLIGDDTLAQDHQWYLYPYFPVAEKDYSIN